MKPLAIVSCVWVLLFLGCSRSEPGGQAALGEAPADELPGEPLPDDDDGDPASPEPPPVTLPAEYAATVDHAFLPLAPGTAWSYAGEDEGIPKRVEIRVLDEARVVLGVPCTTLVEQTFLAGKLVEMTTHTFAEDTLGNVWRFGEESIEFGDGLPVLSDSSWEAGVDGALPWIVIAADPQPGDVLTGEGDILTVISVTASASTPAGFFQNCLDVEEADPEDPEDKDRILYAPGVGVVSEESPTGRMDLVSFGVR